MVGGVLVETSPCRAQGEHRGGAVCGWRERGRVWRSLAGLCLCTPMSRRNRPTCGRGSRRGREGGEGGREKRRERERKERQRQEKRMEGERKEEEGWERGRRGRAREEGEEEITPSRQREEGHDSVLTCYLYTYLWNTDMLLFIITYHRPPHSRGWGLSPRQ